MTPRLIAVAVAVAMMGGCATIKRDHYELPSVALPESFPKSPANVKLVQPGESTTAPQTGYTLDSVLSEWWRLWGNDELNGLIDRALSKNHDLKIATWRIAQLQARSQQAAAGKSPVISLPIESRVEAPPIGIGRIPEGQRVRQRELHQLSLRVDWRADIWGELEAAQQSAELQLWRATYARDDVQRQLVTGIAADYVEYLSLNDRLRVARETEVALNGMLEAVRQRLAKGDATITELEQQKSAVFTVSATIPVLEQQRLTLVNRMAEQMGEAPGALTLSEAGLNSLKLPDVLPGVPSALLLRRPDVRAIEARLLSADVDIDLARTRVLPPLDLSAQAGYGSTYMSQLFQPHTLFWNAVANMSITLFDRGRRSREVKYAEAVYEEMVETYLRVVFGAVREVDDALIAIRQSEKRLEKQQVATDASERAWKYSHESYSSGAVDYLTLLDTERTHHRNQDDLYRSKTERYKSLVTLFGSLGGGITRDGIAKEAGWRPVQTASLDNGLVLMATQPSGVGSIVPDQVREVSLVEHMPSVGSPIKPLSYAHDKLREQGSHWYVELSGIYDRGTLASAGRDLHARMPGLMKDIELLPMQQGRVEDADGERASWYRLFASRFPTQEAAEGFCTQLRMHQQRCRAMSAGAVSELDMTEVVQTEDTHRHHAEVIATPPQAMQESVERVPQPVTTQPLTPHRPLVTDQDRMPAIPAPAATSSLGSEKAVSLTDNKEARGYAYAIQIGSFSTEQGAQMLATHWQDQGYDTTIKRSRDAQGNPWHAVRMGHYASEDEARVKAQSFTQKENIPAVVVRVRNTGG